MQKNARFPRIRNSRKPGFTYLETLVSVICILLFLWGFQNWMVFVHSHKTHAHLQRKLSETSHFIACQLHNANQDWIQEETFFPTPFDYQAITNDPFVTISVPLASASSYFSISLPPELLENPYQVLISKSSDTIYQQEYVFYHVIVFVTFASSRYVATSLFVKKYATP
jgi:type II secretory pathway pseudopilin PulG